MDTKTHVTTLNEPSCEELDAVSGGIKIPPNYQSPNVIDERGGQITVWGVTFGFDVNGNLSSVTPAGPNRPV